MAKKINLLYSMLSLFCMLKAQSTILFISKEAEYRWKESSEKTTSLCDTQNTSRTMMEKGFQCWTKPHISSKYVGVQKEHRQTASGESLKSSDCSDF